MIKARFFCYGRYRRCWKYRDRKIKPSSYYLGPKVWIALTGGGTGTPSPPSFYSSSEAGHPHCHSLCSFFPHRRRLIRLRVPRSFLFVSFLAIYDIRNTIYDSWRTWSQPIRTFGKITAHIKIVPVHQPYLYQKLSKKATQLRLLGMSYKEIAKSLNINKRTAIRACKYGRR